MTQGKILIVEDDVVLVRMYRKKFELEGFEIIPTYSGGEGLAAASREKPDCILLDLMMPGIDGFTVMKTLKEDANTKDIPIVVLTNLGTSKIFVEEAKRLGAKDYLIKYKTATKDIITLIAKIISQKKKDGDGKNFPK